MNLGSVLKVIHSSWIDPAISLAVFTMIHRIFSPSLDQQKTWFALNDELCVIPPRKFCSNGIFDMFPEEICRVEIGDLKDENGGLVPLSWFNKGAKASDTLYAGTTFALLAGNLRRKNPVEGEFFKSEIFQRLRTALNSDFWLSRTDDRECQRSVLESTLRSSDRCNYARDDLAPADSKAGPSSADLSNHSPKIPPKVDESPPKCSTPTSTSNLSILSSTESPLSSSSSPDGSLSSVSDIECSCFAPLTKKRKIRKKVETVMENINTVCSSHDETLSEMIAQCCLFQRKDNFDGKKIVRNIFERVEKDHGVRKTFEELVPEELWRKRVDEMCPPDWILLLSKLESRISDDGWQTFLNRTKLGKSGVSRSISVFDLFIDVSGEG